MTPDGPSMNEADLLAYYTTPGMFTQFGRLASEIEAIPGGVASVARLVQGLLIHEAWAPAYRVTLPAERIAEKQLHGANAMLARAKTLNPAPLIEKRPPLERVVGVCRHFATLFVACLHSKGIPARARCGFANYFEPGKYVDHWVGEYWNGDEARWVLVDAQVDDLQRKFLHLDFDTLDVPRDRFLVAGDAWRACRSGADAMKFGIGGTDMWGLVEVYGDVFQDLAALQNIELLPWEWYGLALDESAMAREVELIDRLAAISHEANAHAITQLQQWVAADPRISVPREMLDKILLAEPVATPRG